MATNPQYFNNSKAFRQEIYRQEKSTEISANDLFYFILVIEGLEAF